MIFNILFILSIILIIVALLYYILSIPYEQGNIFINFLFAVQIILLCTVLGSLIRIIINILFGI